MSLVVGQPRSGSLSVVLGVSAGALWAARPVSGERRSRRGGRGARRMVLGSLAAVSAGGGRERFEFLERGEDLGRPRPCVLEVELRAAA